jgi:hypothetical protein
MKKWKQLTKTILASVMAFAMVAGYGASVAAAPVAQDDTGVMGTNAQGIIGKNFEMTEGVAVPVATFNYNFTLLEIDSTDADDLPATKTAAVAITTKSIAYSGGEVQPAAVGGIVTVSKDSADVLAGIAWPHAGEYIYQVVESATTGAASVVAKITNSQAEYKMVVHVENELVGGTITGNVFVKLVEFIAVKNDDGSTTGAGAKKAPGFTNVYEELAPFEISKMVTGKNADITFPFRYTLTMTRSPQVSATATSAYSAYIYTYNTVTSIWDRAATPLTITFAGDGSDATLDFTLTHNQKLVFEDAAKDLVLPTGTKYTLLEKLTGGLATEGEYVPSAEVVKNGGTAVTIGDGTQGVNLSTGAAAILGENTNSVAWNNLRADVSPTGILLNNLPYILLIVVALGGFAGYIVSKRRKQYAK